MSEVLHVKKAFLTMIYPFFLFVILVLKNEKGGVNVISVNLLEAIKLQTCFL